ncbi:helix-turn-helix domain-containing protein [Spirosoma spitsbergense]|uniref:helix-turn-helix domain-containing protein n=1 Tax=Spirosoma spitsbergense TaxID=431554 RepID=UPI000367529C|nr:helix-turn-helix domain-containing protein [Spirosoma spitsbergense]
MDANNFILTTPDQLKNLVVESVAVAFQYHRPAITPAPDADELLTPEETATLLKVSKVTVWQWSKPTPGILNPRRIGNQVRYLRSEVIAAARPTKKGTAA